MFRLVWLMLFTLVLLQSPVRAVENESVLAPLPKGYKLVTPAKPDASTVAEIIPATETPDGWTEKVTVQKMAGLIDMSPAQYRARAEKAAADSCPDGVFEKIKDGTENLYPVVMWLQKCPRAKATGKPEWTWVKGIQGRESFFVVQKASRFEPNAKQAKVWDKYFDGVRICDLRVPAKACKPK